MALKSCGLGSNFSPQVTDEGAWELPALSMPLWHEGYFEVESSKGSRCRKKASPPWAGQRLLFGKVPFLGHLLSGRGSNLSLEVGSGLDLQKQVPLK